MSNEQIINFMAWLLYVGPYAIFVLLMILSLITAKKNWQWAGGMIASLTVLFIMREALS